MLIKHKGDQPVLHCDKERVDCDGFIGSGDDWVSDIKASIEIQV